MLIATVKEITEKVSLAIKSGYLLTIISVEEKII